MSHFIGPHDGFWVTRFGRLEPCSVPFERWVPRTVTINVFECLGIDAGQLVWCNSDDAAMFVVELLDAEVELAALERKYISQSVSGPWLWSRKASQRMEKNIVQPKQEEILGTVHQPEKTAGKGNIHYRARKVPGSVTQTTDSHRYCQERT
jgi:hypothetical protein